MTATGQPQSAGTPVPPLRGIGSPEWLHAHNQRSQTHIGVEPGAAHVPQAGSPLGAGTLGRTSLGLAVVIVLIFVCGAVLKRFGPYKRSGGRSLDIIASQSVGPRERVVVMEINDTWLVLGVAPNSVNTLHTMAAPPPGEPTPGSATQSTPSLGEAFSENLRRASARFSRDRRA